MKHAVMFLTLLTAAACGNEPRPARTKCERYADVKLRCLSTPTGLAGGEDEYYEQAKQLCSDNQGIEDDAPNARLRDEIQCAKRTLDCIEFYQCALEEGFHTASIQKGWKALRALERPGTKSASDVMEQCGELRLASVDLVGSDRYSAPALLTRGTAMCERDAWVELARQALATMQHRPDHDPERSLHCADAEFAVEQIATGHREDPAVREITASVRATCPGLDGK